MIYILLSIFSSSIILVIFKLFRRYNIDTFQAIVVNYVIAFSVGFLLYGSSWRWAYVTEGEWPIFAVIIGFLFISLFLLMGKSAQENGVGTTSVAVKMSLAIPVMAAIVIYGESVTLFKVIGVILALIGVYLITKQQRNSPVSHRESGNVFFLVILFVGSGLLDTLINYVEKKALGELSPALFTSIGFGIAACLGILVLLYKSVKGTFSLELRNVIGGIALGVPNYFSIYFLIMAIRQPMEDSITYAINNVGIVMFSFFLGILFFREKLSVLKWIGVGVAITAILLLML